MSLPCKQSILSTHTHLTEVLSQCRISLLPPLFSIQARPGVRGLYVVGVPGLRAAGYPGD